MSAVVSDIDAHKKAAALAAFDQIKGRCGEQFVLGVGTGSTVRHFIDLLSEVSGTLGAAVSSSHDTRERLRGTGVELSAVSEISRIDVYVDGADEVAPDNALIKGGGAALTGEKILASASAEFICIVDETKLVDRLGAFPLPLEVIPLAVGPVSAAIADLGGRCMPRKNVRTDYGNVILDAHGLDLSHPNQMEQLLNGIPGVVTNGIFAQHRPHKVVIGTPSGVMHRH